MVQRQSGQQDVTVAGRIERRHERGGAPKLTPFQGTEPDRTALRVTAADPASTC